MNVSDADLALNAADDWLGPVRSARLIEAFGSAEAALKADAAAAARAMGRVRAETAASMLAFCRAFDAGAERRAMELRGARALRLGLEGYPALLAALKDPPRLLYVAGELPPPGARCVAIVGTREPSDYGVRMARAIAAGLAGAGVWVVSGMARGIDAEAHDACLEAGGRTLAVQGRGLAEFYPASSRGLGERILRGGGAVVSQFSMDSPVHPKKFPQRNALISGFSLGVVVVEGERDSGSLITADLALEQGREVMAVPGRADEPMSQGPLHLIDHGARLVRDAHDVLETLGLAPPRPPKARAAAPAPAGRTPAAPEIEDPGLDPDSPAGRLWAGLGAEPAGLDQLAGRCGLDPAALAAAVTELELMGVVRQLPGARLQRGPA